MKRTLILTLTALVAIAATAFAATYAVGTYKGKTAQGLAIKLAVAKGKLKSVHYTANFQCFDPRTNQPTGRARGVATDLPAAAINKRGKVDKQYSLFGGNDRIHLVATFKGKNVRGTFNEAYLSTGHHICSTQGKVSFSAKR